MYKKRIIPCLDIKNGRVVKGINFVNLVDAGDPSEQAKFYSENGADEICFLDITASNENRDIILEVVRKTSENCFVPIVIFVWQCCKLLLASLITLGKEVKRRILGMFRYVIDLSN